VLEMSQVIGLELISPFILSDPILKRSTCPINQGTLETFCRDITIEIKQFLKV